jgi:hypothetical protein
MFLLKNLNIQVKRSKFIRKIGSSEAKRTCSKVLKIVLKRSEHVYIKEIKYRSEANAFDSLKIYFKEKRTCIY